MRELPIPFQPPLAVKTHRGDKTQTRRLRLICKPGDRLWVREAWLAPACFDHFPPRDIPRGTTLHYMGDGPPANPVRWGKFRPPMFMPRWASRTLVEVTDVRNHQLQTITLADAIAEGVDPSLSLRGDDDIAVSEVMVWIGQERCDLVLAPVARFALLWDSINGRTAGANWTSNPQVWAYTFHKVAP